jgi:hypothetical protein
VVCSGASYLTGFRRSLPRCSIRRRRRSHDRERLDRNDGMSFVVDSGSTRCDQGTEREREAERPRRKKPRTIEGEYRSKNPTKQYTVADPREHRQPTIEATLPIPPKTYEAQTVEDMNRDTGERAFVPDPGSDTLRPGKQERELRTKRSKPLYRSFPTQPTKDHAVAHENQAPSFRPREAKEGFRTFLLGGGVPLPLVLLPSSNPLSSVVYDRASDRSLLGGRRTTAPCCSNSRAATLSSVVRTVRYDLALSSRLGLWALEFLLLSGAPSERLPFFSRVFRSFSPSYPTGASLVPSSAFPCSPSAFSLVRAFVRSR